MKLRFSVFIVLFFNLNREGESLCMRVYTSWCTCNFSATQRKRYAQAIMHFDCKENNRRFAKP